MKVSEPKLNVLRGCFLFRVQAGLVLGLFGGTGRNSEVATRCDPHVLVVGDPGLGKSQVPFDAFVLRRVTEFLLRVQQGRQLVLGAVSVSIPRLSH